MCSANRRQRPTGCLSFHATNIPAGADTALMVYSQMSAQAACLKVFSPQQLAIDHCRAADSRPECQHDDVIRAATSPCVPFPQQSSSGVVFQAEWKIEFGLS